MIDKQLLVLCIKAILGLLVIWIIWNQVYRTIISKKALKSTNKWCDVGEKIRDWKINNPNKSSSHPELQTIIKEEIGAYKIFLKYHPYCEDNGKYLKRLSALIV